MAGISSDRCPECGRLNEPLHLLASYREKQLGVRRDFFLYEDRIVVRVRKLFGNESEFPIRLAFLNPDLGVLRIRSKHFNSALGCFVLGTSFAVINCYLAQLDRLSFTSPMFWIFAAIGCVGLGLIPFSFERVEFYSFRDVRRPEVSLLDIARRGPDVGHFEEFADQLRRQIRASRKSNSKKSPADSSSKVSE